MVTISDIRYAFRALTRKPGFSLLVIATLGLGIGATTAIFSALYRLNYAQLPFETADRLVMLARTQEGQGFFMGPRPEVVEAWQGSAKSFEGIAMSITTEQTMTGRGEPASLRGARISPGLADMLRVTPLHGRMFTRQEALEDAPVVVLSEDVWRSYFGGDRGVVGQQIRLGERTRTIVGVMHAEFSRFSEPMPAHQFWLPYVDAGPDEFGSALGVLRQGIAPAAAAEELDRLAAGIAEPTPGGAAWKYTAVPLTDMIGSSSRQTLPLLIGAAALVLLIACANVAGLMIIRLNGRRREIAIRASLGARRARIIAGIATEQALLAIGAGGVGLLLASWGIAFIARISPDSNVLLDTLALDPAVLAFAAALVIVATFTAGMVPALSILRGQLGDSMRRGGDRVTSGSRARSILVAAQVAVSLVLLVGAALLIRSFAALEARDMGFEPAGAMVMEIALPPDRYPDEARRLFFQDIVAGVRVLPGVSAASLAASTPPNLGLLFGTLKVADSDVPTDDVRYLAGSGVSPGFLPTLGARFIDGRDFADDERDMTKAIVNRRFVERFWPGTSGVGRRLRLSADPEDPWIEIVGVIEDIRANTHADGEDELQLFYPQQWDDVPGSALVVRSATVDPLSLLPAVRQVVGRLDASIPLRDVATLEQRVAGTIARQRFTMLLLATFAGLALLLTIVGLYGLVAWSVQQRVREVGIRVALGATNSAVRVLFLAHGMRLVAAGLAVGVLASGAAVTLLRSMVFGVPVYDGVSFVTAVAVIAVASLTASWVPARRAARVDPLTVLREE